MNSCWSLLLLWLFCATTSFPSWKSSGPSPSTLRLLPFCRNFSWFQRWVSSLANISVLALQILFHWNNLDWWSRDNYLPLLVCTWLLPWLVHSQLDLPVLHWELPRLDCHYCWNSPDHFVLWLLLPLYHKRYFNLLKGFLMQLTYFFI